VFPHLVELPLSKGCVLSGSLKKFQKSSSQGPTFGQMAEEMFKTCDIKELNPFAGIALKVWFRRNEVVHGGSFLHLTIFIQQTCDALGDFSATNNRSLVSHSDFE
jgi:hypothetical protein